MVDCRILAALAGVALMSSAASAQTLPTHRIPAALAVEAASETVAACAKQGYHETAQVVDADGVVIATMRGDIAGAHTLDSALYKAYTAASFKSDTLALAERSKGEELNSASRQAAACDVFRRRRSNQARRRDDRRDRRRRRSRRQTRRRLRPRWARQDQGSPAVGRRGAVGGQGVGRCERSAQLCAQQNRRHP